MLNYDQKVRSFIRRHRWIPAAATLVCAIGLTVSVMAGMGRVWIIAGGATLLCAAYVWGYSVRATKHLLWPPLNHLQRRSYGEVWDAIAVSAPAAAVAVSGQAEEDELRRSAAETIHNLRDLVMIGQNDELLEIGCGVARIGLELAPHCRAWTGADTSTQMVRFAKERLNDLKNVRIVHLPEVGLAPFPDASFDVIYSTNVFPHIDEIDRWRYAEEAFRVLRPGGRIFIDNVDIESDLGWTMFANDAKRFRDLERPPYMPRYSTAAELKVYATRAGFDRVQTHRRGALVIVTGAKATA